MLKQSLQRFFYASALLSMGACSFLQSDKLLPEGQRISVLNSTHVLSPDYAANDFRIKLPRPKANSKWTQPGGNSIHMMSHLKSEKSLNEFWSADFGEGSSNRDFLIAEPVIAHKVVFTIDADAIVSARRLDNGKEIWHKRLKPLLKDDKGIALKGAGLAYGGQRIYATTGFGRVFALDMKTGKEIWHYNTTMPFRIAPTFANNRLLVQTIDNTLIALNAIDGHEIWQYKTTAEATTLVGGANPAYDVDKDVAVAAFSNGEVRAFKASTGTPLWAEMLISSKRTNSLANITAIKANPIIDGNMVYAGGYNDIFMAIDLRTGRKVWEREISTSSQPWIAGQVIYVLSHDFELLAIEKTTGKIFWTEKIPLPEHRNGLAAVGPVLANNSLIVALSDGHIFAFSPYSGKLLGFINIDEDIELAPVIADGIMIFTTSDAHLFAYK